MRVMGAQSLTVDLTTDIRCVFGPAKRFPSPYLMKFHGFRLLWSSDIIAKAWRKRSKSHVPSNAE